MISEIDRAVSIPTVNLSTEIPNVFNINNRKKPKTVDRTEEILNQYIMLPLPSHKVGLVNIGILGKPESGKSVMITSLAKLIADRYGLENVNIIWSNSLIYCINHFDQRPVQVLIIDDAMMNNSSRTIHKNAKKVGKFNKIRHLYEEATGNKSGFLIVIWAWQRWMDLDPAFKQLNLLFLKTGLYGTDKEEMLDFYGEDYYRYICNNWEYISKGNDSAKSKSIVHAFPAEGTGRENGVFILKMLDFPEMPEFVEYDESNPQIALKPETEEIIVTESDRLEELRSREDTRLYAYCYEQLVVNQKSCKDIAKELGKSPATVSRYAKRAKDIIENEAVVA